MILIVIELKAKIIKRMQKNTDKKNFSEEKLALYPLSFVTMVQDKVVVHD